MQFYLSIDDTDNLESPGSGQLAESLAGSLSSSGLACHCTAISRHQLYVHDAVPYTSHNSSMCFTAEALHGLNDIISFSQQFLKLYSAPGSDPGLCIAVRDDSLDRSALIAYGLRAKRTLIDKEEAIRTAGNAGVHLSEHGGTGDGIIGALAGAGLRMSGDDGRLRGWLDLGRNSEIITVGQLLDIPAVDRVTCPDGSPLPDNAEILIAEPRVKTVLNNHLRVVPTAYTPDNRSPKLRTLTKKEIKKF